MGFLQICPPQAHQHRSNCQSKGYPGVPAVPRPCSAPSPSVSWSPEPQMKTLTIHESRLDTSAGLLLSRCSVPLLPQTRPLLFCPQEAQTDQVLGPSSFPPATNSSFRGPLDIQSERCSTSIAHQHFCTHMFTRIDTHTHTDGRLEYPRLPVEP